jgi:hypothetical protein
LPQWPTTKISPRVSASHSDRGRPLRGPCLRRPCIPDRRQHGCERERPG